MTLSRRNRNDPCQWRGILIQLADSFQMRWHESVLQAAYFDRVLRDRVRAVLVSMDHCVITWPHQRAESVGPIRRRHYHDSCRLRPLWVPGIFQPTRALARRGQGIRGRFPDTNPGLPGRSWHYALFRVAGLRFFDRKIAGTAGTFSLHFPVHRAWRRTRLARFRSAAVTDKIFSLDREPHSRIGLGALASPARWKRISMANCSRLSSLALRRHFYADVGF
jgi:hypothetical protein